MLTALYRAFAQLADPPFQRVIWTSVIGALLAFLALALAFWFGLYHSRLIELSWVEAVVDLLGGVGVVAMAWLLFPAVAASIAGLLLETVARAVERRYYPELPPPVPASWFGEFLASLRFLILLVLLNFLALPLYLIPVGNFIVFYGLNGYLLSREYFEMVARRRLSIGLVKQLRRAYSVKILGAGVMIAFLSTVPVLNLLVPVLATAFMVHLFQALAAEPRRAIGF